MDTAIGRVLNTLHELDLDEWTFVFFFADNGAFMLEGRGLEVSSNAPLRNGGVTCWEGGIRVAALVRWPDMITPGTVVSEPIWSPDLMPTVAGLAGATLPTDRILDGADIVPVLRQASEQRNECSFYFTWRQFAALRQGDWKIVWTRPDMDWQIFNLCQDVGETRNPAQQQRTRLEQLTAKFESWQSSIVRQRSHSAEG
jgi:arylsulfatase A